MTDSITNIALSDLLAWDGNVRKTGAQEGLEELMASIQAHGLLQPLVVKPAGGKSNAGKYHVVAGQRRLMALNGIGYGHPVPCTIIAETADAEEISLAENAVRLQMHPIDQFAAYAKLQENGAKPAEIAARFGVAESTVLKLLKLARVSPKILQAYRDGDLNLEQVQAFASSDDIAQQEAVFDDINPQYVDADEIRDALTPEGDIPATDKRAAYVGTEAYVKAGGKTRSDLFSEQTFLLDANLLDNLASLKLSKSLKKIEKEGWAWVEIDPALSWEKRNKFGRIHERAAPLPEDLQAEYDALEKEAAALNEAWYESEDDEKPARLVEIEARIEELEDRECTFQPAEMALAGCILTIDHKGKADIERGLVKPEDKPRLKALEKAQDEGNNPEAVQAALDTPPAPTEKGMSASLIEELTKHHTAALAVSLAQNPNVSLATIVYTLAAETFCEDYTGLYSCVEIHGKSANVYSHPKDTLAERDLENEERIVRDRIPAADNLWQWCLEQDRDTLLNTLAFLAGQSVNAIRKKTDRPDDKRLEHAAMLTKALKLNMSDYFRPDAENYFGKISKDMIMADLKDITGSEPSPAQLKMKKGELAKLAEKLVDGTDWLPEILRSPENADEAKPKAKRKRAA